MDNTREEFDGIMDVLYNLAREEKLKVTLHDVAKAGIVTGVVSFLGGLFLGPPGLFVAATIGGLASYSVFQKDVPLHRVLSQMKPDKKKVIYEEIKSLMTREHIVDIATLRSKLGTGTASQNLLKDVIIMKLTNFVESELKHRETENENWELPLGFFD